jgi:translation initiation factor IF-3
VPVGVPNALDHQGTRPPGRSQKARWQHLEGVSGSHGRERSGSQRRNGISDRHMQPPQNRGQRINEQIRISPVRLIGVQGEQLGVIPTTQAMDMAREAQLDLGKFRYQQSRKGTKTKPHQQKLKEIRVRPKTGEHDIETKINQARRFLEHKDKVLLNVLFRGRELQHIDEGRRIITSMVEKLADLAKIEKAPTMEGKRMTAMLAPKA